MSSDTAVACLAFGTWCSLPVTTLTGISTLVRDRLSKPSSRLTLSQQIQAKTSTNINNINRIHFAESLRGLGGPASRVSVDRHFGRCARSESRSQTPFGAVAQFGHQPRSQPVGCGSGLAGLFWAALPLGINIWRRLKHPGGVLSGGRRKRQLPRFSPVDQPDLRHQ